MPSRNLLVLYGSTRGSSLKAAEDFVSRCKEELSAERIEDLTGEGDVQVTCDGPLSLDAFLEDPNWTSNVIVFVSSFGSGDAPMKGRKFRKKCDEWIKSFQDNPDKPKPLTGIEVSLCGLGDSSYETYMNNPKVTCQALTLLGAEMLGERGEADATNGSERQAKDIQDWVNSIFPLLAKSVSKEPRVTKEQLNEAREFVLDSTN
ncbi:hypothetical protein ACA910_016768 [Epithemia clementina (nom. ined.)]